MKEMNKICEEVLTLATIWHILDSKSLHPSLAG